MKKFFAAAPALSNEQKSEFEELVKLNMKRAYFTALGILGNHDAAMEISQEAFLRAFKNFHRYDKKRKFFSWYYKILKNLCLNFIRDRKKRESGFLRIHEEFSEENPAENFEKKELLEKMEEALNELPTNHREIIILKEFENLSYKEIAEILEIPAGTVMSKLFYARKSLAEKLNRKL